MIEVISSGIYTTVQDLGRYGYRDQGIPLCGAMDQRSAIRANQLCNNPDNAALLEMTAIGATLQFQQNADIALTGGVVTATLNDTPVDIERMIHVPSGARLKIGRISSGIRSYLAVRGGLKSEVIFGSASQCRYLTLSATINKGDSLHVHNITLIYADTLMKKTPLDQKEIIVYKGPEYHLASERLKQIIENNEFVVDPKSNRMAYQLGKLSEGIPEIITGPVQPGTVQCTPQGDLIVLMRDAQTTGGYGRILQLTEESINVLAQKRAGERLAFTVQGSETHKTLNPKP